MENLKEVLLKNHQDHLLKYLEIANEDEKQKMIKQIDNIDILTDRKKSMVHFP